MINTIYIEDEIAKHPRTLDILQRFPDTIRIPCNRYTEIFNRKAQNFRLQKKQPALILANKFRHFILPTPKNYGIGASHNYYFSHMMNCIYDCRYCFLQGMYRSAHYVVFVNFESFSDAIEKIINQHHPESVHFFSGYDCDSLALETVTRFTEFILPLFEHQPHAVLELRTKSTQIRSLLNRKPLDNIVVAYSFTPAEIAEVLEHKTPSVQGRINAMIKLQARGWLTGLRFDPLIYEKDYQEKYTKLFENLFSCIDVNQLHSVSLGSFRLPKDFFRTIQRLYPDERLYASPFAEDNGMVAYQQEIQDEMVTHCSESLLKYIPDEKFFPCHETTI